GNTYTISATWDASTMLDGELWTPEFITNSAPDPNEGCYASTPVTFHALNVGSISVNSNPVQVNTADSVSASFSDPNTSNTHTASWDWGDGNSSSGTVTESN